MFGGTTDLFSVGADGPRPLFGLIADGQPEELTLAVGALALAAARQGTKVKPILVAPLDLSGEENGALTSLPFPCVRFPVAGRAGGV